jgi:hypothetical protein
MNIKDMALHIFTVFTPLLSDWRWIPQYAIGYRPALIALAVHPEPRDICINVDTMPEAPAKVVVR